jgi:hypothetical protein
VTKNKVFITLAPIFARSASTAFIIASKAACNHFDIKMYKALINLTFFPEWKSAFFTFLLIIEGTAEKVFQFIIPFKSAYNKNLGFIEQKMFF